MLLALGACVNLLVLIPWVDFVDGVADEWWKLRGFLDGHVCGRAIDRGVYEV